MKRLAAERIGQGRIENRIRLGKEFNQFRDPPTDVSQFQHKSLVRGLPHATFCI